MTDPRPRRVRWPDAVSDGLTLPCHDCGEMPRFDYRVDDAFWRKWVPGPERLSVVCLPCIDNRCEGEGLYAALREVQWIGSGYTVVLNPRIAVSQATGDVLRAADWIEDGEGGT